MAICECKRKSLRGGSIPDQVIELHVKFVVGVVANVTRVLTYNRLVDLAGRRVAVMV
jgi:hypothetical protein